MKQNNFLESKSNLLVAYIIGTCLLLFCLASGYKLWLSSSVNDAAILQDVIIQPNSILTIEEELVDKFHPEFILNDGDTLGSLLDEASITSSEAIALVNALAKKFNPRKLNIGTIVTLNFDEHAVAAPILNNMVVSISNSKKIEVARNSSGDFVAYEVIVPLVRQVTRKSSIIKNSFIGAALELAIPSNAIMGMIRAFSYDIDFQRDIKHGDKLEVVMEKFYTEDGKLSHTGNILYSSLTLGDRKISIYQFIHPDGEVAYYNEKGESIKKEFLRTPVNAAKISSKFGMRAHPVLGYTRMHKGIDFAAPVGTPILAAGGGVVETATRFGSYGKYIRIKHNATYSTVYGHASRFAKGIRTGSKVTQGQVIAYVGMTGVTSGPHLHYEVLERGKQINPLKFNFASNSEKLTGKTLEAFKSAKKQIDKQLTS
jgi:murein DD-endopeptidase MepM/ murein hydrolase activator NlpD